MVMNLYYCIIVPFGAGYANYAGNLPAVFIQ